MTTTQRIAKLAELGNMSDTINALDRKTVKSFSAYTLRHTRNHQYSATQIAQAAKRYENLRAQLTAAYEVSVAFSKEHGIVTLPAPEAFTQR